MVYENSAYRVVSMGIYNQRRSGSFNVHSNNKAMRSVIIIVVVVIINDLK